MSLPGSWPHDRCALLTRGPSFEQRMLRHTTGFTLSHGLTLSTAQLTESGKSTCSFTASSKLSRLRTPTRESGAALHGTFRFDWSFHGSLGRSTCIRAHQAQVLVISTRATRSNPEGRYTSMRYLRLQLSPVHDWPGKRATSISKFGKLSYYCLSVNQIHLQHNLSTLSIRVITTGPYTALTHLDHTPGTTHRVSPTMPT